MSWAVPPSSTSSHSWANCHLAPPPPLSLHLAQKCKDCAVEGKGEKRRRRRRRREEEEEEKKEEEEEASLSNNAPEREAID